jgi:hypothetical protein
VTRCIGLSRNESRSSALLNEAVHVCTPRPRPTRPIGPRQCTHAPTKCVCRQRYIICVFMYVCMYVCVYVCVCVCVCVCVLVLGAATYPIHFGEGGLASLRLQER